MTFLTALINVVLFGAGAGIGQQSLFQLWSGELFPTLLRSTAQGFMFGVVRIALGGWILLLPLVEKWGFHTLSAILFGMLFVSGLDSGDTGHSHRQAAERAVYTGRGEVAQQGMREKRKPASGRAREANDRLVTIGRTSHDRLPRRRREVRRGLEDLERELGDQDQGRGRTLTSAPRDPSQAIDPVRPRATLSPPSRESIVKTLISPPAPRISVAIALGAMRRGGVHVRDEPLDG